MKRPARSAPTSAIAPADTRRRLAGALVLCAVLALFMVLALPFLPHTVDDAWITFRYSRNWALGHGPYFNVAEHIEGYSNFLLMAALALVIRLAGPDAALPASKAIGLGAALAALAGSYAAARWIARAANLTRRGAEVAGLAAAALTALAPGFQLNAVSGLETTLYAGLLAWGTCGLASGTPRGTRVGAIVLGVAALARPEGPLLFLACWLLAGLVRVPAARRAAAERTRETDRRMTAREWLMAGAPGLALIGAHVMFRLVTYDGAWLPNTFHAKLGGSGDRIAYVLQGASSPFLGVWGLLLALAGWASEPRSTRAGAVIGGVALLGCALPFYTGGDWMLGYRLLVPYLPLLAAMVAVGWLRLAARALGTRSALASALLLATVPVAAWSESGERRELLASAAVVARGAETGHAALAEWLHADARPGDAVVLMDIGRIAFRLPEQRILDVTGLTDRHIAESPGAFMAKRFDPAYVFDQHPRYVVLSFLASGEPYAPLRPEQPIYPFSDMEDRLASNPEFARHYLEEPSPAGGSADDPDGLAVRLHALRVFRSAAPGHHYLLAVYRRRG
jgi:hypothetical protein